VKGRGGEKRVIVGQGRPREKRGVITGDKSNYQLREGEKVGGGGGPRKESGVKTETQADHYIETLKEWRSRGGTNNKRNG